MHDELKERLKKLENNYNGKEFLSIVNNIKKNRINDDELLEQIETLSLKRFREKVTLTLGTFAGNALEIAGTTVGVVLPYLMNNDFAYYISALILMATLHPLSHFLAGRLVGIRFTHYYLNGPARIEPTLRINYYSYLKTNSEKRALMHASGVIGTLLAPLIAAHIAFYSGSAGVAQNLIYFFLLLIVFELLTSTKIGDLMKAKREYGLKN
ncbi:MAG: hypothetical protein C3F06_08725 [Candidatus Methanoperedenaceae archaeon]|nr:MAG: hypothetical protein C3F06_08725 [Candidatus Methanoperedenaceae archaeon]